MCHFIQMKRLPGAAGVHRREPGAGGEERELVTGPLACAWRQSYKNKTKQKGPVTVSNLKCQDWAGRKRRRNKKQTRGLIAVLSTLTCLKSVKTFIPFRRKTRHWCSQMFPRIPWTHLQSPQEHLGGWHLFGPLCIRPLYQAFSCLLGLGDSRALDVCTNKFNFFHE